jgi:hypothetical protein
MIKKIGKKQIKLSSNNKYWNHMFVSNGYVFVPYVLDHIDIKITL